MLDKAGQKGTGKWTAQVALDLAVAIPTIAAAIDARVLSSMKDERVAASKRAHGPMPATGGAEERDAGRSPTCSDALYAARICAYAQGMALIRAGSDQYSWNINLAEIGADLERRLHHPRAPARSRAPCASSAKPDLVNLLLDPAHREGISAAQAGWRRTSRAPPMRAFPMLSHTTALGYFDSYRTARLPQSLTQAQRDAFGAHTYERIDRPGAVHSEW